MSKSVDGSLGTIGHHTKVKIRVVSCYIGPLYGTILENIFDKKAKISQKKLLRKILYFQ
jgi:hypothetical protein